jgi:hypothetical protein
MCEPITLSTMATVALGTTAAAGVLAAKSAYDQGRVAKATGRNNQIMAEYAAQDAIRRGDEQANQVRQRASQIKGAQRAGMAAKGLDLGVGTSAELQDQTDFFGATDMSTARSNAQRDAWSARASGSAAAAAGNAAATQANMQAFSTLLSTGGQVAGKWYDYGKPKSNLGAGHGGWT